MGSTLDEQVRLRDLSRLVAGWSSHAEDNVPTVPCLSADGHLLVLSAGASRVRYGMSITFIMVYPNHAKAALPKDRMAKIVSLDSLNLWCIFDDGSVTPAYTRDHHDQYEPVSLLDCSTSLFASDELWRYGRTLQIHLVSITDKNQSTPILKAFVSVPTPPATLANSSRQLLTLCTSPLRDSSEYLLQWIQFHLLVGFRKFVIYNTTDTHQRLASIVEALNRKHPNLIDVVQWNFSPLHITDQEPLRYFQVEALHDCLIRYGDQSEWLGMLDLDEYVVPMPPYTTVLQYLHENFARRIIGSVNLCSQFFCTKAANEYSAEEKNTSHLVIERFTLRAPDLFKDGRQKYLYRPRFVQHLSIHRQVFGLQMVEPSPKSIMLAHYFSMTRLRTIKGCAPTQYVNDTSIRDRFAERVKRALQML